MYQNPNSNIITPVVSVKKEYGVAFAVIPFLAALVAIVNILISYHIAVNQGNADPFPYTDITHTMIHWPEYLFGRIGLITSSLLMVFTWYIVAWFLQTQASIVNAKGNNVTVNGKSIISTGTFACFMLCISTATMSDGGDMNWTLHSIGATGFFILILYLFVKLSGKFK
jgi:hypothetical protein